MLGESVKVLATDVKNEFLITGDTLGYIKVWDLFPYCHHEAMKLNDTERQQRRDRFSAMFLFLRNSLLRDPVRKGFF